MSRRLYLPCFLTIGALTACSTEQGVSRTPTAPTFAKAGGGDIIVTSIVADADASIAQALQIRSDGLGAYINSRSLSSIIQGIGAWVLDSKTPQNGTRTLYLDFSRAIPGTGPNGGAPVTLPTGLYKVRVIAKCNAYGTSMLGVAPGGTIICPLHIALTHGGTEYAIQMTPFPTGPNPDGSPETNYVNVACTSPTTGTGPCGAWRITPSGTSQTPEGATELTNVVRLIKHVAAGKGQTTPVNQGNFLFSFAITVTNP